MRFELFDPKAEFAVIRRHLPHWEQPGATYFLTWRLADSLPKAVVNGWVSERNEWLIRHQLPLTATPETVPELFTDALIDEYRAFVSESWEAQLDECHGSCPLRDPELARIVADSLLHFDGTRYLLSDFVVMPNHLHALVCFPERGQLRAQCRSWKKFTGTAINKRLGRRGEFWQDEGFDHMVRSPELFEWYREYIAANPRRAKLSAGESLHWQRPNE